MKLRIVRFLRTPEYDELFSGDPTWVTESIGGIGDDGRPLVTRTSFRFLQTLYNLGPAPEPNLTVLWSPRAARRASSSFCAQVSIDTSAIQYESDDQLRAALRRRHRDRLLRVRRCAVGKQMQFFGARVNLGQGAAVRDQRRPRRGQRRPGRPAERALSRATSLDYDEVWQRFDAHARLAGRDLRPRAQRHPLHARQVRLRAARDGAARPRRPAHAGLRHRRAVGGRRLAVGDQATRPCGRCATRPAWSSTTRSRASSRRYGNNDDRVDDDRRRARARRSWRRCATSPTYRDAVHTQSVLTITSNVVYGKHTGSTPDGRRAGEPFAPGANPMNGRDPTASSPRRCRWRSCRTSDAAGRHLADDLGRSRRRSAARRTSASTTSSACSTATSAPAAST